MEVTTELDETRTIGRPRVITNNVLDKLRTAFLVGSTDEEACSYAEISTDVLYKFQRENPEFINEKEQWKTNPVLKAKVTIYKNLHDAKVAMWYLEKRAREEFGEGKEYEKPSGKLTLTQLMKLGKEYFENNL